MTAPGTIPAPELTDVELDVLEVLAECDPGGALLHDRTISPRLGPDGGTVDRMAAVTVIGRGYAARTGPGRHAPVAITDAGHAYLTGADIT